MRRAGRRGGYSIVEVLIVLVIVGVLALVGAYMVGSKSAASVRAVLDQLEGTISGAHERAIATGRDVTLAVEGTWTEPDPFLMAYGDATTADGTSIGSSTILSSGATAAEAFRYLPRDRDHMHAGIVATGSSWWTEAATGSTALSSVEPFSDSSSSFASLVSDPSSDSANLSSRGLVKISGVNKRFTDSFYIAVVGLKDGKAFTGGPMGLVVVLKNGATVYKFYNPGIVEGDGTWRKL